MYEGLVHSAADRGVTWLVFILDILGEVIEVEVPEEYLHLLFLAGAALDVYRGGHMARKEKCIVERGEGGKADGTARVLAPQP